MNIKRNSILILFGILVQSACTDHIVDAQQQEEEIETTGIPVNFNTETVPMYSADSTTASLLAKMNSEFTRTAYLDTQNPNKRKGISGAFIWSPNDVITVFQVGYNSQGNQLTHANYVVTSSGKDTSSIVAVNQPMEWQANKSSYRFFATYPAINSNANKGIVAVESTPSNDPNNYQNTFTVTVKPNFNQVSTVGSYTYYDRDNKTKWFFADPDMTNCYLIAADNKTIAGQQTAFKDNVGLTFSSAMSALMIGVHGPANTTTYIKRIRVYLKDPNSNPVNFQSNYKLRFQNVVVNNSPRLICNSIVPPENASEVQTVKEAVVEIANPVKVGQVGDTIVKCMVTLFLPPHIITQGQNQLQIIPEFVDTPSDTMPNDYYTFSYLGRVVYSSLLPSAKVIVNTVQGVRQINMARWMAAIPNNTLLKDLSIPGAHTALNVYPQKLTSNAVSIDEANRQANQYADLESMLYAGVRAFDIRLGAVNNDVTISRYGWSTNTPSANLFQNYNTGTSSLPNSTTDVDANSTINKIHNFLANTGSKETVILLLSVDKDVSNISAWNLLAEKTIKPLIGNAQPGNSNSKVVLFKDNLTLGEARGKVVVMIRPSNGYTQQSETYFQGNNNSLYNGLCFIQKDGNNGNGWIGNDFVTDGIFDNNYLTKDCFANNHRYFPYQQLQNGRTMDDMAFSRVRLSTDASGNNNSGTMYYLDKEIIGKMGANRQGATQENSWNVYWGDNENPYNYSGLYTLKTVAVNNFLDMAMDKMYQDQWFTTFVPGRAIITENVNERFGNGSQTYNSTYGVVNTWASVYQWTHEAVKSKIKETLGQGRKGIVFFDLAPGRVLQSDRTAGNFTSYNVTMGQQTATSPYPSANVVDETKANIGKDINYYLIKDNFMRSLRQR